MVHLCILKLRVLEKMIKRKIIAVLLLFSCAANAQELNKQDVKNEVMRILDSINKAKLPDTKSGGGVEEHWYDKISLRGYAQIRYNGLFSTNDKVSCDQCDKSWEQLQPLRMQNQIMDFLFAVHV